MKLQPSWLLASTLSTAAIAAARPWTRADNTTSPIYFFTFGDSYSQTGFSTSSTQPSASNPMGNPDLGIGTTTNGPNWIGYLTTTQNASLVLSYNLAVGGATIDNSLVSAYAGDVSSQVKLFEDVYSTKPASTAPWTADNAVFGVWIGINDIGNAFYKTDAETYTPLLTTRLQALMQEVYDNGGRKFLFLNVPPTDRTPMFIDQGSETTAAVGAYLGVYNRNLKDMVERWGRERGDVITVFYDAWSFMTKVLDDPTAYGFPDATCINDDGTSCVWWNNYHPGMKYHALQAEDMKKFLGSLGGW
ncbi:cellulose-binding GDSL lipase/acylhydrolase [Aspergillus sclerotioniger CBS 115572]|uniref:Cellulose-binding GDSL lipase/acylhydrolase n=1 Tax=Aspergillus sclerotioniger CBS 115572 TaxID=1450535 RepID=A0A317VW13_9EURO|nr:cellulose-binding GDSL lipase/acylhydrolase [Aspergillus sclerotioniger CBS 115572]PWY78524.1 cellulose-binding GDSL lipase/acylhydrolase [Aspergillus sclerotioniger CBS 115572]